MLAHGVGEARAAFDRGPGPQDGLAETPVRLVPGPRVSRHSTNGMPASIITESWRVKTARFLAGADPPRGGFPPRPALRPAGSIRVTRPPARRRAAGADPLVAAMRPPRTFRPAPLCPG